jgi:hypothetical protein
MTTSSRREPLFSLLLPHTLPGAVFTDHGTFVPLLLMYPDADIPVVQMSCMSSMDPRAHFKVRRSKRSLPPTPASPKQASGPRRS